MRRAEETRACHLHCLSPICTTSLWWLSHAHTHTLRMIGMPPTKPDVTYTLRPVNGALNQMAFCLRKLLQICMATSNLGRAAWPCRCLKYQAGRGYWPQHQLLSAIHLTGALFLWISSFKGTGIFPLHEKLLHRNLHVLISHAHDTRWALLARV